MCLRIGISRCSWKRWRIGSTWHLLCKSLTKARRKDQFANVKILRSDARPEGFGCKMTKEANKLIERCVEIARQQLERNVFFSIENPWESFIWDLRCVRALMKLTGV